MSRTEPIAHVNFATNMRRRQQSSYGTRLQPVRKARSTTSCDSGDWQTALESGMVTNEGWRRGQAECERRRQGDVLMRR